MTREEARQIIATWLVSSKGTKRQRGYIEGWFDEEDVEAFRMAIEALKRVSFENDTEIKSCSKDSDLISRADAVPHSEQYKKGFEDAKRAFLLEYARESENMQKRIAELEVMLNAQKAISADRPRGGDFISRAEAIEAVRLETGMRGLLGRGDLLEILYSLPSAEAEWIDIDNYHRTAICSHCRKVTMFEKWEERTKPYDYCPNCGAKMDGERSEE